MSRAIAAVQKERWIKLAAQRCSVPQSTLQCYLKNEDTTTKPLGCPSILWVTTEPELVRYIKLTKSRLSGLMSKDVIKIAFTLAQCNKIKHLFVNGHATHKTSICQWTCGSYNIHLSMDMRVLGDSTYLCVAT